MTKSELRVWAKEKRIRLDLEAISLDLVKILKKSDDYKKAKNIMIFYPKNNEVNLLSLLKDDSKSFYLPKINGDDLLCCPFKIGDELCESCFKTKEPLSAPIKKSLIDLVIVPALAVDKNNYRLGYGGGFYDRFLAETKAIKIVCLPKKFYLDTIFPKKYDIPVDKLILV